jgi:hypothetical protein
MERQHVRGEVLGGDAFIETPTRGPQAGQRRISLKLPGQRYETKLSEEDALVLSNKFRFLAALCDEEYAAVVEDSLVEVPS